MSFLELWQLFRRRWWVIALVAVVAAAVALGYSLAQAPSYRGHAEVVVLPSRADWNLSMYLEARMRVFRAVLLALPETDASLPPDLADRTHVQLVPEEGRVVIEVDDRDPQQAAVLANTLADRLRAWVDEFNETQVGIDHIYVRTLVLAEVPKSPSSPRYKVNTAAGAVLGALLGLPLAFLWDALEDTLGDPERAAARLGIAVWPTLPPFPADRVAPQQEPSGDIAAAFHRLHTSLRLATPTPWHTLAVLGPTPADLPPALVADLGAAIAQEGATVLLVDADFSRPALHEPFGLAPTPSLTAFLQQERAEKPAAAQTGVQGLSLLPAGEPLPPAGQAVALQRAARALPALAAAAEVVLLRLPDPQSSPEGLFLAARAGAVLLTARAGRSRGREVRRALAALGNVQASVLGLVLWPERRGRD
jgi:capsular polysaccharide biosynthesis protein